MAQTPNTEPGGVTLATIPPPWFYLTGMLVVILFLAGLASVSDAWGTAGIIFLVALWVGWLLAHPGTLSFVFGLLSGGGLPSN